MCRKWQSSCQQRCSSKGTGSRIAPPVQIDATGRSLRFPLFVAFLPAQQCAQKTGKARACRSAAVFHRRFCRAHARATAPTAALIPHADSGQRKSALPGKGREVGRQQTAGRITAPAAQGQGAESRVVHRAEKTQASRFFE